MIGSHPQNRTWPGHLAEHAWGRLRPTQMEGRIMFRIYEWNFSATAEAVVGALLAITLVLAMFV
jgi:hypothetical protein